MPHEAKSLDDVFLGLALHVIPQISTTLRETPHACALPSQHKRVGLERRNKADERHASQPLYAKSLIESQQQRGKLDPARELVFTGHIAGHHLPQ